jgi:hypothetical protein
VSALSESWKSGEIREVNDDMQALAVTHPVTGAERDVRAARIMCRQLVPVPKRPLEVARTSTAYSTRLSMAAVPR